MIKRLVLVASVCLTALLISSCGGGGSTSGTSNSLQIFYDPSGNCKSGWPEYRPIDIYVDLKYWGRLESGQAITKSVSTGNRLIQALPFTSGCKKNVSGTTVQAFSCLLDIIESDKYYAGTYTKGDGTCMN